MITTYKFLFFILILFPLIGSILQGIVGFKNSKTSGIIATFFIFIPFLIHLKLFETEGEIVYLPFITFTDFNVNFSFIIEKINILMGMMVTFVSSLIHFYSIGYMEKDDSPYRYFAFLNLFVFFMLIIVYSGNFLLMFLGWEGVGLCSYLLISYETWREEAKNAGTKAFFITRFADFGFILFLLFYYKIFGTFEISALRPKTDILVLPLLIFALIAGTGKSAQFPFYIWLPDAMEGPTPVSALIHAATMVTAGVWLLIKIYPLFEVYPFVLNLVLFIGTLTLLLSGLVASFERDLKKILAYSTISQIGYMFFAVGTGYPLLAFLHLLTHAFFKALLFLSSGNVMHMIHKKINIFETRGMRKVSVFTAFSFLIGSLALAGFPLTGGFISKELIISASFKKISFFYLASIGVFLTSFYIMRGYSLCFEGEPLKKKYSKNSLYQNISLLILIIFVIITGLPVFENFYFKIFSLKVHFEVPFIFAFFPLFLMGLALYISIERYTKETPPLAGSYYKLVDFFRRGFYYDDFVSKFLFGILRYASEYISRIFDRGLIDFILVEGTGKFLFYSGKTVSFLFTRKVSFYLFIIFAFIFVLFLKFL